MSDLVALRYLDTAAGIYVEGVRVTWRCIVVTGEVDERSRHPRLFIQTGGAAPRSVGTVALISNVWNYSVFQRCTRRSKSRMLVNKLRPMQDINIIAAYTPAV